MGLALDGAPPLPMQVTSVDPQSAAASKGAKRGDYLLAINGSHIQEFERSDLAAALRKRPLQLSMVHAPEGILSNQAKRAVECAKTPMQQSDAQFCFEVSVEDARETLGLTPATWLPNPVKVASVIPKQAAAQQGATPGDQVMTVTGEDIQGMLRPDIVAALRDQPLTLGLVHRSPKAKNLPVDTRQRKTSSILDDSVVAPSGFYDLYCSRWDKVLGLLPGTWPPGAVVIDAIVAGSVADNRGVRAGDKLMQVDGELVQSMEQQELVDALRRRPVLLRLKQGTAQESPRFSHQAGTGRQDGIGLQVGPQDGVKECANESLKKEFEHRALPRVISDAVALETGVREAEQRHYLREKDDMRAIILHEQQGHNYTKIKDLERQLQELADIIKGQAHEVHGAASAAQGAAAAAMGAAATATANAREEVAYKDLSDLRDAVQTARSEANAARTEVAEAHAGRKDQQVLAKADGGWAEEVDGGRSWQDEDGCAWGGEDIGAAASDMEDELWGAHATGRVPWADWWEVQVDRTEGGSMGIEAQNNQAQDGSTETLEIDAVHQDGLVSNWNSWYPYWAVRPGDRIYQVNGVVGWKSMQQELRKNKMIDVSLARDIDRWTVEIDKSMGEGLGLGVVIESYKYIIADVFEGGLAASWNAANPSMTICRGNRIIEVNGRCEIDAMTQELARDQWLTIGVVDEPPPWSSGVERRPEHSETVEPEQQLVETLFDIANQNHEESCLCDEVVSAIEGGIRTETKYEEPLDGFSEEVGQDHDRTVTKGGSKPAIDEGTMSATTSDTTRTTKKFESAFESRVAATSDPIDTSEDISPVIRTWVIQVDCTSGGPVGFAVDVNPEDATLQVATLIKGSLVTAWNEANPSKSVRPGDKILEVNGRRGPKDCAGELHTRRILKITVARELRRWRVEVCRSTGRPLMMELHKRGDSREVTAILGGGLMEAWNIANPSYAICPGDRLLEANGKSETVSLIDELNKWETLVLMFSRDLGAFVGRWQKEGTYTEYIIDDNFVTFCDVDQTFDFHAPDNQTCFMSVQDVVHEGHLQMDGRIKFKNGSSWIRLCTPIKRIPSIEDTYKIDKSTFQAQTPGLEYRRTPNMQNVVGTSTRATCALWNSTVVGLEVVIKGKRWLRVRSQSQDWYLPFDIDGVTVIQKQSLCGVQLGRRGEGRAMDMFDKLEQSGGEGGKNAGEGLGQIREHVVGRRQWLGPDTEALSTLTDEVTRLRETLEKLQVTVELHREDVAQACFQNDFKTELQISALTDRVSAIQWECIAQRDAQPPSYTHDQWQSQPRSKEDDEAEGQEQAEDGDPNGGEADSQPFQPEEGGLTRDDSESNGGKLGKTRRGLDRDLLALMEREGDRPATHRVRTESKKDWQQGRVGEERGHVLHEQGNKGASSDEEGRRPSSASSRGRSPSPPSGRPLQPQKLLGLLASEVPDSSHEGGDLSPDPSPDRLPFASPDHPQQLLELSGLLASEVPATATLEVEEGAMTATEVTATPALVPAAAVTGGNKHAHSDTIQAPVHKKGFAAQLCAIDVEDYWSGLVELGGITQSSLEDAEIRSTHATQDPASRAEARNAARATAREKRHNEAMRTLDEETRVLLGLRRGLADLGDDDTDEVDRDAAALLLELGGDPSILGVTDWHLDQEQFISDMTGSHAQSSLFKDMGVEDLCEAHVPSFAGRQSRSRLPTVPRPSQPPSERRRSGVMNWQAEIRDARCALRTLMMEEGIPPERFADVPFGGLGKDDD